MTATTPDGAADLLGTARAVVADLEPLPFPGAGTTARRWQAFADIAMRDLSLVRLVEGHFDAQAILQELGGPPPGSSGLLGVWAARPAELRATRHGGAWTLDGTKPFCSGSTALDQALVTATAEDGVRLFLVDGAAPTVRPESWRPLGMAATRSETLVFEGVRLPERLPVGPPDAYVDRPGFGHGGCGVAACWWGGAVALLRDIRDRLRSGATDGQLARFAAVTVAVDGAAGALRSAATAIDAAPDDPDVAELWAAHTRLIAATAARETVAAAAALLGTQVVGTCPVVTGRLADLTTYLTQFHDESAIDLGARLLERDPAALCWNATPTIATTRWAPVAPPCGDEVVVAAPHPDDEILGCGMALRRLAADGRNITIAACTDGEASHARSTAIRPEELVRRRVDERASAFAILGIAPRVVRLGLPDGDLASRAADLADALATLCSPATTLVVPWEHDGHPDHRAVALAGRLAAGRSGAALWRTPIWGKVRRARAFAGSVHRLELGAADRALKRRRGRGRPSPSSYPSGPAPTTAQSCTPPSSTACSTASRWSCDEGTTHRRGRDVRCVLRRHVGPRRRPVGARLTVVRATQVPAHRRLAPPIPLPPGLRAGVWGRLPDRAAGGACRSPRGPRPGTPRRGAARRRCARWPGVRVTEGRIPGDWPDGAFDLIVLSELLYYLDDDQLEQAMGRAVDCLRPGGHLVAVHYRRPVREHARAGDEVHERLTDAVPQVLVRHVEDDFLLEVRTT